MATVTELKKLVASDKWASPRTRWQFGTGAAKLRDAGQTHAQIAAAVGLEKKNGDPAADDVRHAVKFAEVCTSAQARRLKNVPWKSITEVIIGELTDHQRRQLIDAAPTINSTELKKLRDRLRRNKAEPRLRGNVYTVLTVRADEFAATCEVFVKQAGDAESTPARRKKLIKSLMAVRTAVAAAIRAANKT